MAAPEIKTVRDLVGKSLGAVALTDATAIAAREILKGNGIDPKNPAKGTSVIRAVLRTMAYMRDPKNHSELVEYILKIHKIDAAVAAEALATVMAVYTKDGTKPRDAVQKEIDIYREALKIPKPFTPEDLGDMSHLRRALESLNR